MSLADLGSLGEFLGSLGVLATLVYLAIQVRQNSKLVVAQTRSEIAIAYANHINSQREDKALVTAGQKIRNGEKLSETEASLIFYDAAASLRLAENAFYQARIGHYSNNEFEAEKRFWADYFSTELRRKFWEASKGNYSIDFAQEFDELLDEGNA